MSVGYVYLKGRWRTCTTASDELAGCSERELQLIADEVRKRNRFLHGRGQVEVTQQQLARFRRENAAHEIVLRQQRKDRETRTAYRVLEGGVPSGPPPSRSALPAQNEPKDHAGQQTKEGAQGEDRLLVFRRIR